MITWKIYKDKNHKWHYRIDYEYSSRLYYASTGCVASSNGGRTIDCIESGKIEKRRIKYLVEKMMDSVLHLRSLTDKGNVFIAKELLGING